MTIFDFENIIKIQEINEKGSKLYLSESNGTCNYSESESCYSLEEDELSDDEESLFNEVLNEYSEYSAIKLMNMTHEELPWVKTFSENPQGIISMDLMTEYFKTQIVG